MERTELNKISKNDIDLQKLKEELYSLTISTKTLESLYKTSRMVDLDEIGKLLVESKQRIQSLKKRQGFLGSISSKMPILSKITKITSLEANLQQSINSYTQQMVNIFDEKYNEISDYLESLELLENQFIDEINAINDWISKVENIEIVDSVSTQSKLLKILTEAKSEVIRKTSSIESLIKPTITLATELIQNINSLMPVLKDKVYTELKTLVGLNSFKDMAKMSNEFKTQIVELEKLNTKTRTETLIEILKSVETNLMSKEDFIELEKLRTEGDKQVKKALSDLIEKQQENQEYILEKYQQMKETGKFQLTKKEEILIEAIPTEPDENRPSVIKLKI